MYKWFQWDHKQTIPVNQHKASVYFEQKMSVLVPYSVPLKKGQPEVGNPTSSDSTESCVCCLD